ncbi:DUF397 domain-containing protein [Streptomyces sp. NPDC046942]|uniref:DUF397 domain-containing protein n=1 Tax=Streptomyces sp. NPDC046942 TaxID=3155137 RepID=UPI0033D100F2
MPELHWKKSSYSPDASNCVEVAPTPTTFHIRDSKTPTTPHLTVTPTTWAAFLRYAVGGGEADA